MRAWKRIHLTAVAPIGVLLSLLLMLLSGAATAVAMAPSRAPVDIPPGQFLVDDAGVLGDATGRVQQALDETRKKGITLYVVYVRSFDGQDPVEWAQTVLVKTQPGVGDTLLAVATDDRKDALVTRDPPPGPQGSNVGLNQTQKKNIKLSAQNPLISNAWDKAALDAAEAVQDAAKGGEGKPKPTGGFSWMPALLVLALVGLLGVWFWRRRRSGGGGQQSQLGQASPSVGPMDPLKDKPLSELKTEASSLLIAADDAIRSSEQELAFAQAAYGETEVEPFHKAITAAKEHLRQSFALQQKLDDDIPDTPEEQRDWYSQIIRHCEQANEALEAQKNNFTALRELEKNAPQALERISSEAARATTALEKTAENLRQMAQRYPVAALSTVNDNVDQARARLEFVHAAATQARQSLAAGNTSATAVTVHAAEEALQQAILLEDAVTRRNEELQKAQKALPAALASAESDLVQARALVARAPEPMRAQVEAAAAAIEHASSQVEGNAYDPAATLSRVEAAHRDIDQVLASMRNRQEQGQRAVAALQPALMAAQAQLSSASDYIVARRGGVGAQARTRLAEAQRNLDYALSIQNSDPATALTYARQASGLAEQAQQLAYDDVSQFGYDSGDFGYMRGGPGFGHHGSSFASSLGGALLGGIVGNLLSGNRWGGGGFGGWSSSDSGGFDWGGGDGGFGDGGGFSGDSGNF